MALFKYTGALGDRAEEIAIAAGDDLTGTDKFAVHFDTSTMTQAQAVQALEQVQRRIIEGKWPPL